VKNVGEVRWSWRANRITSVARAVGGRLFVDGGSLVFRAHLFDRALRATEWSVALGEITSVDVSPQQPGRHMFGAGLRRQLRVEANGDESRFIVNRADDVAARLREIVDDATESTPA
jgi:hypothetical protein